MNGIQVFFLFLSFPFFPQLLVFVFVFVFLFSTFGLQISSKFSSPPLPCQKEMPETISVDLPEIMSD